MTASHPQYFIVIDSISPHSNSQLLTAIHCDEPNTGFEPRLISAHFFCPLVWLAVTKVHLFFTVFQNRIYIILILRKVLSLVIYANKVLRTDVQATKEKYGEHYILL